MEEQSDLHDFAEVILEKPIIKMTPKEIILNNKYSKATIIKIAYLNKLSASGTKAAICKRIVEFQENRFMENWKEISGD